MFKRELFGFIKGPDTSEAFTYEDTSRILKILTEYVCFYDEDGTFLTSDEL